MGGKQGEGALGPGPGLQETALTGWLPSRDVKGRELVAQQERRLRRKGAARETRGASVSTVFQKQGDRVGQNRGARPFGDRPSERAVVQGGC